MARFTEAGRNRKIVDQLVDTWRERCLIKDGSLLEPESEIWTTANLAKLRALFVENQLEGGERKFMEKLEVQLGEAGREPVVLMAEIVAIYCAFASRTAMGAERKRELINEVLDLTDEHLDEDGQVFAAMTGSIGGPGQAFNNYRPNLLIYLIRFGAEIKALDDTERLSLLSADSDPWEFCAWLDSTLGEPSAGAQTMRNILLHLLFPDSFERIASDEDKQRIINSLHQLVEGLDIEAEDFQIDRGIWEIRQAIEALLPSGMPEIDGNIDFYYPPLREAWDPDPKRGEAQSKKGLSHLDALETKQQVVLHGPPGTGKTFEAKSLAEQLIRHQALLRWGPVDYLTNESRIAEIVESQVKRLQLHPAYSYEDFIGGLRLVDNETRPEKGYLLWLIDEINSSGANESGEPGLPWVLILDEINRSDLSRLLGEVFSALDDREAPIELSVAGSEGWGQLRLPRDLYLIGTMNLIDQSVEQLDFALRRRFFWLESGFDKEIIVPVVSAKWEKVLAETPNPFLKNHGWERIEPEIELLAERANELNAAVTSSPLLGHQYELGHTYFFEVGLFISRTPRLQAKGARRSGYLWNANGSPAPALLDLWSHSLEPLLTEYLAGLPANQADDQLKRLRETFLAPRES